MYVSDQKLKAVHRVNVKDSSCSKWSVSDEPISVLVTRSSNVLVAFFRDWIEEYTTEGSLVRIIEIRHNMTDRRICELSTGELVFLDTFISSYKISVMDIRKSVADTVLSVTWEGKEPLTPYLDLLAVDRHDNLLIAQKKNLIVLDSSLSYVTEMLPAELKGHGEIHCLLLDSKNSRFLLLLENYRVLVFSYA